MILAAGLGTRLKPWTDHHPKALAIVNGKSLLERNIRYLALHGFTEIIVNVHHFADQIETAIKENHGWGSHVQISDERDQVLETGGGIMKAKHFLEGNHSFLIMNVDILTTLNLSAMVKIHEESNSLATLAIQSRESDRSFLFDSELRLSGWERKSTQEVIIKRSTRDELNSYGFSGIHILDPRVFELETRKEKFSIVETYLNTCAQHHIQGYTHQHDIMIDVGRPESVIEAEKYFK